MCDICDGMTWDESRAARQEMIDRYGWAITVVHADHRCQGWAYTVGLLVGFGHPELVVVGVEPQLAGTILNTLGDRVRDGMRLRGQTTTTVDGRIVGLSDVHPRQLQLGVFACWTDLYSWLPSPPEFHALEVVPMGFFCDEHPRLEPLLSGPSSRLTRRGLRRARGHTHRGR